ncbi:MAG: beta-galactosidase [Bacteroidota bacterium]
MKKVFLIIGMFFLFALSANAQISQVTMLKYGVAYYDVYMPEPRLEKDIALMKECGINTVRIAESTWSTWEPSDGVFDFSRLDKMLDAFYKAKIDVIVGTPTYAIPQWLAKKNPEVMVTTFKGSTPYGSRQNMDITNPDYLRHAERIIRELISRASKHEGVIGFQIDNETKSYHTASKYAKAQFIEHLKNKFKTTDNLNRTWNMYFWSQSISDWNDLHITGVMANQAISLEWTRFQHQLTNNFLGWQKSIIDEYKKDDQFVTQNFDLHWKDLSAGPQSEVNHYLAAKHIDIAGADVYHKMQDDLDGVMISFAGDNARGLKHTNYFILETNNQIISWHSDNIFPPYDNQLRLCFYSHFASGANMVSYWPWHTIHNGGETYIRGVLSHDMLPNRGFNEVKRISTEVKEFQQKIINLKKTNKVAILYSIDSFNALKYKHMGKDIDYSDIFMQIYRAFYKLNVEVDIITPHNFDLNKYELVIIPPLLIGDDAMLTKISNYVKDGGDILMFYKSGLSDENYNMRSVTMPGILTDACGFNYQDYTNTKSPIPFKDNPFHVKEEVNYANRFMELLVPNSCNVLAQYDHKHWGKYAAITQNDFEKGSLTYVGTLVSDEVLKEVAASVIRKANLNSNSQKLQFPLVTKQGVNQKDRTIRYVFNYSDSTMSFKYPFNEGTDLISKTEINVGDEVIIDAWDLIIVEEK